MKNRLMVVVFRFIVAFVAWVSAAQLTIRYIPDLALPLTAMVFFGGVYWAVSAFDV